MNKKHALLLLIVASLSFATGYYVQEFTVEEVSKKVNKSQLKSDKKEKRKIEKNSTKDKQERKKSQLSDRKQRQQNKKDKKDKKNKNSTNKSLTEEQKQKQIKRQEKIKKKIDKRFSQKVWWGEKGKAKGIELGEETKQEFDKSIQELLEVRKQLGTNLAQLQESNRLALIDGDLLTLNNNLVEIDEIKNQWMAERRAVISDIISSLTPAQLAEISNSGGDVSGLNWFDFQLDKGFGRPKKNKKNRNN